MKSNIVFVVFLIVITVKLHLFAKYTDTLFVLKDAAYFKEAFKALLKGNFEPFYEGLYLISIGSILVLSFWTILLKGRKHYVTLLILDVIISFLMFADLVYYRYFQDLLSVSVLAQANQTGDIKDSIIDLIKTSDILFFIDLLLFIPIVIYLFIKKKTVNNLSFMTRSITAGAALVIGILFISGPIQSYIDKYGNQLFTQNWYNMAVYYRTGLIGFHALDVYNYVDDHFVNKKVIAEDQEEAAKKWFKEHQQKLMEPTPFAGTAAGKNVLIVQLEAFNNFFINKKVNGQEITPNLNRLLEDSMYYENFYHQTAQGRTSDAEFLANESLYPLSSGSVYVRFADKEYDALPRILGENGYETAAFHSYEKSFWNRYVMYNNIGFDHFYGESDFQPGEIAGWALGDRPFFQQAVDKLVTFEKPFYGFLVALTSHHPYNIQAEYQKLNVEGYEGVFANYLHAVHYVDQAVGELVERLKKEGLWDETIFIAYGDHDYGVDESEMMLGIAELENTPLHAEMVFNQIPFFMHLPHDEGKGIYSQAAGQIDIAPTILHLLGIDTSQLYMMGNNMLVEDPHIVAFRYGSFTDGQVYFKASPEFLFEKGTCYDLESMEEIEVNACRSRYFDAREQLLISDDMITGNLIKKFKKEQ